MGTVKARIAHDQGVHDEKLGLDNVKISRKGERSSRLGVGLVIWQSYSQLYVQERGGFVFSPR